MKHIKNRLKNGMTIVMLPIKDSLTVNIGFFLKVGSKNEEDYNHGISHFLEHLMFKGTKNRKSNELFDRFDHLGAEYNAVTGKEFTFYYTVGGANDIKSLLDLVLDIYVNPKFSRKEIERERNIVIQEMMVRDDDPFSKLMEVLEKKMYDGSSLSKNVVGTRETIASLNRKDFIEYRKNMYRPNNTVFVIAGGFNPGPIYKIVEPILSKLENPDIEDIAIDERSTIIQNMENQNEPYCYIEQNKTLNQAYVILAFPMYDLYQHFDPEIDCISKVLTGGLSSRLFRALRENDGATYHVSSNVVSYSVGGAFMISFASDPEKLISGLMTVCKEISKLRRNLITEDELEKVKNMSKYQSKQTLSNQEQLMIYLGMSFLHNYSFRPSVNREVKAVDRVNRDTLRDVAREIFITSKINLFIYGNTDLKDFSFLKV